MPRTSLSLPPSCPLLPGRCWESTGDAGAGAALPAAWVPAPRLLSGGFEGSHLPGPGQCHLLSEHAGVGKLQEGGTWGAGGIFHVPSVPHPGTVPGTVRWGQPCPRNTMCGEDGGGSSKAEPQGNAELPGCALQGKGPESSCTGTPSAQSPAQVMLRAGTLRPRRAAVRGQSSGQGTSQGQGHLSCVST